MENIETLLAAVAQTQGFDDDVRAGATASERGLENSGATPVIQGETSGSQLTEGVSGDARPPATPPPATPAFPEVGQVTVPDGKRKRGRPPKGQLTAKPHPPKRKKVEEEEEEEEEDVCFICFDGGSLVLCDRKGCPKAYHPACIKRDEAFFSSKSKWNCGWHICSVCRKTSHYICFTCTYSLCKACTKDADYVRIRGNKGLCSVCMKTIMLIENKDQSNNEAVQVDFDDQGSWEYLFKWYWSCIKEKLSLTLSDLTQAKRPWKGPPAVACKPELGNVGRAAADGRLSNTHRSLEHLELNKPHPGTNLELNDKLRTTPQKIQKYEETVNCELREHGPGRSKDAVKPTMDKVADEPTINRASGQPGIENDQGKPSIGKVTDNLSICSNINNQEAGKLIIANGTELVSNKEDSNKNSPTPAAFVSSVASDMVVDGGVGLAAPINYGKQNKRKKSEDRASQNNLNEYAAIDIHNINLIYLWRDLMANLLEDQENFSSKVIGSMVRIRASPKDQKHVSYRLVQVVGTSKAAEPYKIGERNANVVLEVLNLDKRETVSIADISDQGFTKEECKWLRQTIRHGRGKRFTVGDVQKKALELKAPRINYWLQAEILEVTHLRDRANENGRQRRLREYIAQLERLKSPEERQRRFSEVVPIHADPKMSPNYHLDNDTNVDNIKRGENVMPSSTRFHQNGRKPTMRNKKGKDVQSARLHIKIEKIEADVPQSSDKNLNQVSITAPAIGGGVDLTKQRTGLPASTATATATASVGNTLPSNNFETEKLWHYRDPNGKIQGPFSMLQLRLWSTTGVFPADMRIWTNHEQYDSLVLTDALNGHLHGESELSDKRSPGSMENGPAVTIEGTSAMKQEEVTLANEEGVQSDDNSGCGREKECETSWPHCWDLLKDKDSSADAVQANDAPPLSSSDKPELTLPVGDQENNDESNHCSQNDGRDSSGLAQNWMTTEIQCNKGDPATQPVEGNLRSQEIDLNSNDMETSSAVAADSKSPDLDDQAGNIQVHDLHVPTTTTVEKQLPVSAGILELLSPAPRDNNDDQEPRASETKQPGLLNFPFPDSGSNWIGASGMTGSALATDSKLPDLGEQAENIQVSDLHAPTTGTAENQPSISGILELLSPAPRANNEDQEPHATEIKQPGLLNFPFPDSGPSWSGASGLTVGGVQLPDIADEWPVKPPVQEWDPGLVPASSLKPEIANEYIPSSTSDGHQITHDPPSNPPNMASWLAIINEPIEFDALGEESVSDLLAEVDAMESQGASLTSPTSAAKFAREFLEDCKDDCFSSIGDFSPKPDPQNCVPLGFNQHIQNLPCKLETYDLDSFRKSSVNSSASSEGESSAPVYTSAAGSEFHPPEPNHIGQEMVGAPMGTGCTSDAVDPGWGNVQGNINLVTVQGNVNLVLGGPGQGMPNLGWGTNPGTPWVNPNLNRSPINVSLPWDGQRKYNGGERYTSPRDRGYQGSDSGFGRGRPPRSRPTYSNDGYSRPPPRGQRVCKFYESGRCKKGAYCDYLHP